MFVFFWLVLLVCDRPVSSCCSSQALKEKELGNAAYKKKDFPTALKHYEAALQHDPTNMTYLSNQAGTTHTHTCTFI